MSSREPFNVTADPVAPGFDRLSARASKAIELQERERVRIGFDLHDGPAQTMSAALLQVKMLQNMGGEQLRSGLSELESTLTVALKEVYDLIENLGGRDSDDTDLAARVRSCVDGFSKRYGIRSELKVTGDCGTVSRSLQIATFRIVQEALSNVGRHSEATQVTVDLVLSPSEVRCQVVDDGVGLPANGASRSQRAREPFGLRSMTERARLLDGECVIDGGPEGGTRVRVRIPVWQG
jgi:signal transduction histidine kinase